MKIVRWLVGSIILLLDRLFRPKAVERAPAEQARLDAAAAKYEIYQFPACPFCVKVRRHLAGVAVNIPYRDATREPFRSELLREGGKAQVPCLKISELGQPVRWMYESGDIIAYLDRELGLAPAHA